MKAFAVEKFINYKIGNNALLLAAKMKGQEREEFYVSLSRGFKPAANFLAKFRLNPCAALVAFIHQRMSEFDGHDFDLKMQKYHVSLRLLIISCSWLWKL